MIKSNNKCIKSRIILLVSSLFFFVGLISASTFGYDNPNLPHLNKVNQYSDSKWGYNQTQAANLNASHNDLGGLQGGDGADAYYHLNEAEHDSVATNFLNWITNTVSDLVNYYNKTDTYNKSEIDVLIEGVNGSVNLPISTEDVNKTEGNHYVGETLTYIIDTIQDYIDDLLSRLGIIEGKVNGLENDTIAINGTLAIHILNLSNPHNVSTGQIGAVDLTTDQTINGTKTFILFPKTSGLIPTNDYELVSKYYTDQLYSLSLSWKNPVRTANDTIEPTVPTLGMRYIVNSTGAVGNWTNYGNNITEYNGTDWLFTAPATGDALLVLNVNKGYVWNGEEWIIFNQPITYSATDGVQIVDTTFKANLLANGGLNLSGTAIGVSYDSKTIYIDPDGKLALKPAGINDTYVSILSWTKINKTNANLSDLWDVSDVAPTDGQSLVWSSASSQWIPQTVTGGSGSGNATIFMTVQLASQPSGLTTLINTTVREFYANNYVARGYADLSSALYYRIYFVKSTSLTGANSANATLNIQYSLNNGSTWSDLNYTDDRFRINNSFCPSTGLCVSNWIPINPLAKRDVTLRMVSYGGIPAGVSVSFREVAIQFKVPTPGAYNVTYLNTVENYTNYHYNYSVNIGNTNISLGVYPIRVIATTSTAQAFTNLPVNYAEVLSPRTRTLADLSFSKDFIITATQYDAGHPGSKVYVQFSENQVSWYNLSSNAPSTSSILDIGVGANKIKNTSWEDINNSAKGLIYLRLVGGGGNATIDPSFFDFTIIVRKILGVNISSLTSENDYNHTLAGYELFYNKSGDVNLDVYNLTASTGNFTGNIYNNGSIRLKTGTALMSDETTNKSIGFNSGGRTIFK